MPELICKLLHIGKTTYYKYLKEGYPIISFLLSFQKEEIEELINVGKIERFENLKQIQSLVIINNCNVYVDTFTQKTDSNTLKYASPYFLDFYFSFLVKFNTFEKNQKFSSVLNSFFIDYIVDKYEDAQKLKDIGKYIFLFNNWDELMGIFLNLSLENNLSMLLEISDAYNNKIKKEEIYFHIISLYVYRNHSSLTSGLKIELIKMLHDKTKDEFYDHDLLIREIQKIEFAMIDMLKELGYDRSLY
ncbi:MAG: hypothetical protein A2W82_05490 [Sulfurimonas sp. RIFCSPLOWO2_12_36_12]|uniref:hypothetical protein n=1 Tax=Sulfurimonas sp. RIFCSPLOWO2_12_36_12 TaxID=1802253 RepID=UPI0008C3B1F7|nr:hypothetical protein [Sulfurimonas sp. RIFCSPLOWO2_12_36_12]OHD99620.1 MAG: hypothetical protein A3J26_07850 [Sulfurimonas sp. RIFCSPLOWO2_02_FULL_36_28]OHE01383.1 MAG: hypothetical protein A2W82_05490 [Sulfurimonas sp. RIFCSPLOWO2_12_36_12]